ncbi:MAG: sensor histidine kinase [Jiangellaceae bacterium]|nr:sensor histidine kinase [Jiangellaceae bacterium]
MTQWRAALTTAVAMLAAGVAYVLLWATGPADCTEIRDWTADGVAVDVIADCQLRSGDLVTAVDGRALGTGPAADWTTGQTLDYTVVRDAGETTVPVRLHEPDLLARFAPAWSTLLFIASLLAVSTYVALRRRGPATNALLVLAAGLAGSTLPTLLGLPVVGMFQPLQRWLYLLEVIGVYLSAWTAGLAFALLFPRPMGRLAEWNRWARLSIFTAPVSIAAAVAAAAAIGSSNVLAWIGSLYPGVMAVIGLTQIALITISVSRIRNTADALERQQMRWLVGTGVLALSAGLAGWLVPDLLLGQSLPTQWIGLAALPFVFGLAVALLRHRLFDLDVVLNRGLVYGLLTASVVTLYLVVVTALTSVMRGSSTTPAAIVATAVIAVAVNPLRVVLQRGVDRMMYGERRDPYSALSRLGRRLDDAGDGDQLLPAVARDIADALRVPYVAIELEPPGPPVEAGHRPAWLTDDRLVERPLVDRAERIGRLRVAPRTPAEPLSRADQRLLDDLTRRVGAAARELSLRLDLQRSRERLVLAREEERRRLRRALHDELGPAIAGLGLRTEAARQLVDTDPRSAAEALVTVRDGTQGLVADIRRLAYDLRPPALDELGLAAALRQHADDVGQPKVTVTAADDFGDLPAAVEAAAYRIAVEALTNTIRHAHATACSIRLGTTDGWLEVRVADDGRGLPPDLHAGVGMTAMRERAAELGGSVRVESRAGGGTLVVASLPVGGGRTPTASAGDGA